jgi:hypothetical protein
MDYNTQRIKLVLPEYGRNVLNMVEHMKSIENREERSKAARAIVYTMAALNPQLKDSLEYKHKLWDHLFILADFNLDIDSPFEPPLPEEIGAKPQHVPYPKSRLKRAYYGHFIELAINTLAEMADSDEKRRMVFGLTNQMKRNYFLYNKEAVDDSYIIHDLEKLSGGKLSLPENSRLVEIREVVPPPRWQKKSHRR